MSIRLLHDPEHWLRRAEELRAIAEVTRDTDAKATLLRIVADYEQLAERAKRRPDE
jgi:hypothetical protein